MLWLWRRPVATALIRPLGWEPPYATGAALEKAKKNKKTVMAQCKPFRKTKTIIPSSQARNLAGPGQMEKGRGRR